MGYACTFITKIINFTALKLHSQLPNWNLTSDSLMIHTLRLTSAWPSMESPSGCVVEEQYCRSGLPGDLDCETSYLRESWLSQYSICMQKRLISINAHTNNSKNISWSMKRPLHSPILWCIPSFNTRPLRVYTLGVSCTCLLNHLHPLRKFISILWTVFTTRSK
jgi:hypothetical protein